ILRGGGGMFYDTGSDAATRAYTGGYPFVASGSASLVPFPSVTGVSRPQLPTSFTPPYNGSFTTYTDNFQTPRTWQWNMTVEQQVGEGNEVSVGYIGAHGEHLLRQEARSQPNPNFGTTVYIIRSDATSDYDALQTQYTRRLMRGVEAYAAYTWSHAYDTVSDVLTNVALRGPADFDIRHALSLAFTYAPPRPRSHGLDLLLGGWVLSGLGRWRSAPPVNITSSSTIRVDGVTLDVR